MGAHTAHRGEAAGHARGAATQPHCCWIQNPDRLKWALYIKEYFSLSPQMLFWNGQERAGNASWLRIRPPVSLERCQFTAGGFWCLLFKYWKLRMGSLCLLPWCSCWPTRGDLICGRPQEHLGQGRGPTVWRWFFCQQRTLYEVSCWIKQSWGWLLRGLFQKIVAEEEISNPHSPSAPAWRVCIAVLAEHAFIHVTSYPLQLFYFLFYFQLFLLLSLFLMVMLYFALRQHVFPMRSV